MTLRTFTAAAILAAVTALAACERETEPAPDAADITLTVQGDSLIEMREPEAPDASIECAASFRAVVEGPEGAAAVIRGGTVQYWWWSTGSEAGTYQLTPHDVQRMWVDSTLTVGQERLSHPQTFAQGQPKQPVRGMITFDYAASGAAEKRTTEHYRFYCY
jgi:hypothetical protein